MRRSHIGAEFDPETNTLSRFEQGQRVTSCTMRPPFDGSRVTSPGDCTPLKRRAHPFPPRLTLLPHSNAFAFVAGISLSCNPTKEACDNAIISLFPGMSVLIDESLSDTFVGVSELAVGIGRSYQPSKMQLLPPVYLLAPSTLFPLSPAYVDGRGPQPHQPEPVCLGHLACWEDPAGDALDFPRVECSADALRTGNVSLQLGTVDVKGGWISGSGPSRAAKASTLLFALQRPHDPDWGSMPILSIIVPQSDADCREGGSVALRAVWAAIYPTSGSFRLNVSARIVLSRVIDDAGYYESQTIVQSSGAVRAQHGAAPGRKRLNRRSAGTMVLSGRCH